MKKLIISLVIVLFSLPAFAQKVKTVEGEFVYHVPETESLAEAKKHALKVARLHAIAAEFGTIVSQTNFTRVEGNNSQSNVQFSSFGSSDVKGEWIETIGKPEYNISYVDETLIVHCKVKGKAREIVASQADFQAKVLRRGTDDRDESSDFLKGDKFYMSFQTPVKGYLAIYMVDDDNAVQRLLPYNGQENGIYQVEADRRYVFFSRKDSPNERVDEYTMQAARSVEHNQVYVIFSPNQFVKAVDSASQKAVQGKGIVGFPRELSFDDFHKWLAKCRRRDNAMSMKKILITVKRQ